MTVCRAVPATTYCSVRGPSWKSPFHGLSWPPGTTEAEWAVVSLVWSTMAVVVIVRTNPRPAEP